MTTQQRPTRQLTLWQAYGIVLAFLTLILIVIPWLIATAPLTVLAIAIALAVWAFWPRRR